MDLADRRDTYNGFGDALARAFELVGTPAIFGWLGWLLDGRTGTRPMFTVLFALITFVYMTWKLWGEYDRAMDEQQRKLGLPPRRGEQSDG
jgi:F0F1-type ATP synthase assembly protein I